MAMCWGWTTQMARTPLRRASKRGSRAEPRNPGKPVISSAVTRIASRGLGPQPHTRDYDSIRSGTGWNGFMGPAVVNGSNPALVSDSTKTAFVRAKVRDECAFGTVARRCNHVHDARQGPPWAT